MFDRPTDEELIDEVSHQRQNWISTARNRDVGILGGGLAALTAGIFLQEQAVTSVILTESDYPGGRLTWGNGPIPIFPPAIQQLQDIDFPREANPPWWIDRNRLLSFLVGKYYDGDGIILSGLVLKTGPHFRDDQVNLQLITEGIDDSLAFEDLILTRSGDFTDSIELETQDPLEYEVKGTSRTEEGSVRAGHSVLPERLRQTALPLESAHLLSGRKASEIVLDRLA